ncbi:MAG: MbnP family protein [Saprospiraceae bacterium]
MNSIFLQNTRFSIALYLLFTIVFIGLAGCKKEDTATHSPVLVHFQTTVRGAEILPGTGEYQNSFGQTFRFDMLKYYISNCALIDANGEAFELANHHLIDIEEPSTATLAFDSIPNKSYTHFRFFVGIDPQHNHDGDQEGALDPVHGMLWSWNTGYIFYKHEGSYLNAAGEWKQLLFHYGTDEAYTEVIIPVDGIDLNGKERSVFLNFDIGKLYDEPNAIDFFVDNARQSVSATDRDWLAKQKENVPNAFSFDRFE